MFVLNLYTFTDLIIPNGINEDIFLRLLYLLREVWKHLYLRNTLTLWHFIGLKPAEAQVEAVCIGLLRRRQHKKLSKQLMNKGMLTDAWGCDEEILTCILMPGAKVKTR